MHQLKIIQVVPTGAGLVLVKNTERELLCDQVAHDLRRDICQPSLQRC